VLAEVRKIALKVSFKVMFVPMMCVDVHVAGILIQTYTLLYCNYMVKQGLDIKRQQSVQVDSNNNVKQENCNNSTATKHNTTKDKKIENNIQSIKHNAPDNNDEHDDNKLAFTVSKDSDTYQNIFATIQWYRDSFLIGSDYADKRSVERSREKEVIEKEKNTHQLFSIGKQNKNEEKNIIPNSDPDTAYAHTLLLSAGENYLKSIAAVDLLRPYATWIASSSGPMYNTAVRSMASTIPLAQSSCDWAMKENVIWVLKDEEWREFAKSITTTYVDKSFTDTSKSNR